METNSAIAIAELQDTAEKRCNTIHLLQYTNYPELLKLVKLNVDSYLGSTQKTTQKDGMVNDTLNDTINVKVLSKVMTVKRNHYVMKLNNSRSDAEEKLQRAVGDLQSSIPIFHFSM